MENSSFNRRPRTKRWFFVFIPIIVIFGLTLITMYLWNGILPQVISGVSVITFWQAMGILVLSKILFGGFPGGGGKGWKNKRRCGNNHLSQNEKEKLSEFWKNRCRKDEPEVNN